MIPTPERQLEIALAVYDTKPPAEQAHWLNERPSRFFYKSPMSQSGQNQ